MILKKQRYENGKREIYIFETKVFEYYADKLKKAKRCCDIPYKFLKRLYRENNFQIIHQVASLSVPKPVLAITAKYIKTQR